MKKHDYEYDYEDFEHLRQPSAAKSVLTGLLIGTVVGAVTMLLYAPRAGEETRAELRGKAMELRDRTSETVRDTMSQARSKAYELKENVRDKAAELKQRGKHTAQEQLDRVSEAAETGKQRVQEY